MLKLNLIVFQIFWFSRIDCQDPNVGTPDGVDSLPTMSEENATEVRQLFFHSLPGISDTLTNIKST